MTRVVAILIILVAAPVWADVVSYEAASLFPEETGWVRGVDCTPERWLENNVLHQIVQAGECWEPPGGDQDHYTRSIMEFDGAETFFVEWRLLADGESSEFIWGGPALLTAWNQGGEAYWFAISRDQVKFIQDSFAVILFVDIPPDQVHTHRLEVYGDQAYYWFIDGELIHAGTPGGPYPSFFPSINWVARSGFLESHAQWHYVRFGDIPLAGSGDFNSDGEVDSGDVFYFEECATSAAGSWPGCVWADLDGDADVDCADAGLFVAAWTDRRNPPPPVQCCGPDLDRSGSVDAADLAVLLGVWGANPGHSADLDNDGTVGPADLAQLLGAWGSCE